MTYNPHTTPMLSAAEAIAQGSTYWSIVSSARFHERWSQDRRDKLGNIIKANPASAILARRLRVIAVEVARLTGLDPKKYRGRRSANDNRRRPERRAA